MAKNKIKSVVIVPHKKGCNSIWSGILPKKDYQYYGNFKANPDAKTGNFHLWYRVLCNNIDCPGTKAVHSSVLEEA